MSKLKKELRGIKITHEEVDSYTKDGLVISKFKKEEIHEYMTDLIFLCQKIGRRVFPFGPFGKLY